MDNDWDRDSNSYWDRGRGMDSDTSRSRNWDRGRGVDNDWDSDSYWGRAGVGVGTVTRTVTETFFCSVLAHTNCRSVSRSLRRMLCKTTGLENYQTSRLFKTFCYICKLQCFFFFSKGHAIRGISVN